jgi:quercetin dioxygenase-like cupin family protein
MTQSSEAITNVRTGQKMFFRKTGRETNGTLLEIECFNPSSDVKEPEHIHPVQESTFEVISGKLHFQINGKIQTAVSGEVVRIPAGIPHYFWNGGETEAHYIQRFNPSLHIDTFFRTYFALARNNKLNKKGLPNLFLISLISLNHQNEIRLVKPPWALQIFIFSILAPLAKLLGYKEAYE